MIAEIEPIGERRNEAIYPRCTKTTGIKISLTNAPGSMHKSHSLVYLLNEDGVSLPENLGRFVVRLSEASIPTRYPENLSNVQKEFTERIVKDILARGKEVILWIRAQL